MGLKPSQGELNVTLKPISVHINNVHLLHNDVIIITKNMSDHIKAVRKVMEAVSSSGLTLNPNKCHFGCKEIKFWGMIYNAEGIKPDPAKVDALKYISPHKAIPLQELTQNKTHFKWIPKHQKCFKQLLQDFRKDTLLRYFDSKKKIYIFTNAHISSLGAILT